MPAAPSAPAQLSASVPITPGLAIDLGAQTDVAAGTLELSDAELDTISAPILNIGGIANGNITVSNPITGSGHYGVLGADLQRRGRSTAPLPSRPISPPRRSHLFAATGIGASDDLDIAAVAKLQLLQHAWAP